MKILVFSFYFPPDLSAGSFRTASLINELLKVIPLNSEIEIVTTLPTRYQRFAIDAPKLEKQGTLLIRRIELPSHENSFFGQSLSFFTYAVQAIKATRKERPDLVYATSSRLFTAVLASLVARKHNTILYLDLRDIFLETLRDVFPYFIYMGLYPLLRFLENYAIRSAHRINLVSQGFKSYFDGRYPINQLTFFTNGVDPEFIKERPCPRVAGDRLRIVYAGNFGSGQGLEKIIPRLAKSLESRVEFLFIGDGSRRAQLVSALNKEGCNNVALRDPVPREELLNEYNKADVLFLHLNELKAFERVLPSKIFEYAATGKPIWAGVSGYAANFVKNNIDNSSLFLPCQVNSAIQALDRLDLCFTPRSSFINKFRRDKIMQKMARDVSNLALR